MKNNIALTLALVALLIGIYNYVEMQKNCKPNNELTEEEEHETDDEFELADYMNKLQRHANKLWFAGSSQNWELAQFYVHELEESMEAVEHANLTEDGVELTPLIRNYGLKSLEKLEDAIKNKESKAFDETYDMLVANCNSCHNAANHSFIVIQKPRNPAFDNQVYTPSGI
jgi:hypothetical protein